MSRLIIVVERTADWGSYYPSDNVVSARDYLKHIETSPHEQRVQVINLCRSYKYLGVGYYVSLLAEARGHKVIPSVRTINDLRKRSLYGVDIDDLNQKLSKFLPKAAAIRPTSACWCTSAKPATRPWPIWPDKSLKPSPCPILKLEFERQRNWQISAVKPVR